MTLSWVDHHILANGAQVESAFPNPLSIIVLDEARVDYDLLFELADLADAPKSSFVHLI